MKIWKNMSIGAAALLIGWSMGASRAGASEILYDGVGFLQGTQSFTDSFTLSSPGTMTVTLSNVAWPTQLASLDLLVSSPNGGALGPELDATNSTATATYNVAAGNVVAQWFGTAQGSLNAGVYAMEIQFQPTNPVPLPTSIGLFLSGIGLLIWQRKSRNAAGRDGSYGLSDSEGAQTA
jgi:autotransporter translocation and assembly factor TamB